MKHLAQRQWSQRRRPRLSTTPQSGQVKRGGAMVLKSAASTTVAQQNACWRAVQCCGPIPIVTTRAAVALRLLIRCQEPFLTADSRNAMAVLRWRRARTSFEMISEEL